MASGVLEVPLCNPVQLHRWAWCCGVCVHLSAGRRHTMVANHSDRRVWVPQSANCSGKQLFSVKNLHTGSLEPNFQVDRSVKIPSCKLDTDELYSSSTTAEDRLYRNCGCMTGEQDLGRLPGTQDSEDSPVTDEPFSLSYIKQQQHSRQLKQLKPVNQASTPKSVFCI